MDERTIERSFRRFVRRGDVEALGRVFDAAAPELLGIALRLTGAQDAEDVVQATFVTAIEKAESFDEHKRTMPWMLGILLNHARTLRRSRGRFGGGVALEDVELPGHADVAADAEVSEFASFVDRALSRLPDSYRTVVAHHVRRGLQPREIATELDITANAARVRLFRGLERLRQLLPAGLAGAAVASLSPTAKAASLARVRVGIMEAAGQKAVLLKAGGSATLPAGLTWAKLIAAALLGGCLPLLTWRALQPEDVAEDVGVASHESDPMSAPATPNASMTRPAESPNPEGVNVITPERTKERAASNPGRAQANRIVRFGSPDSATDSDASPPPSKNSPSPAHSQDPNSDNPAVIEGRLLFPDERPAADITVHLRGVSKDLPVTLPGYKHPEGWEDQEAQTDGAGRFRFAFDPPADYFITLEARPEDYAAANWRWSDLPAGAHRDIGDVELEEGGTVDIRVQDPEGNLLDADVREPIVLVRSGSFSMQGRTSVDINATRRDDGTYRVEHVPLGPCKAVVHYGPGLRAQETDLLLNSGETEKVTLVYAGPDLARRIVAAPVFPVGGNVTVRPESWRIFGGSHYDEPATTSDAQGTFLFDGLDEGPYRIEFEDERFLAWSKDSVAPGEYVFAQLKGSSALRLRVFERRGGKRLKTYAAKLFSEEPGQSHAAMPGSFRATPHEVPLKSFAAPPPQATVTTPSFPGCIPYASRSQGTRCGQVASPCSRPIRKSSM